MIPTVAVTIPEDTCKVPNVEIPEILSAVPTRLSEIVIVAPTPDAVATILPPTKFSEETLADVPTTDPSSLIVIPVIALEGAEGTQVGALVQPFACRI